MRQSPKFTETFARTATSLGRWLGNLIIWLHFAIAGGFVSLLLLIDHQYLHMHLVSGLLSGVRKETYGAIATILGALLGFEITGLSILATFSSTRVMRRLHKAEKTGPIIRTFSIATLVLGIGTIAALCGIFIDSDSHQNLVIEYLTLFLTCWSGLLMAATVLLINALLKSVLNDGG